MQNLNEPPTKGSIRYSRVLTLPRTVAVASSVTVGLAIYILLGPTLRLAGREDVVGSYLLLLILALPIALTLAERAGVISGRGGVYNLVRTRGNLVLSFSTGWLLIGGQISLIALLGWGLAVHLDVLLVRLLERQIDLDQIAALVIGLVIANHILSTRVRWSARTAGIFASIAILTAMVAANLLRGIENPLQNWVSYSSNDMFTAAVLLGAGLWGFYFIIHARDEVIRPTKTIPKALLISLGLMAGLGIVAGLAIRQYPSSVTNLLTPLLQITENSGILPDLLVAILYAIAGIIIILSALNRAIVNTVETTGILIRDGFLPDRLNRQINKNGSPVLLLIGLAVSAMLLIFFVDTLLILALVALSFFWTAALAHVPDLFRRKPNLPDNRRPKLPFHPLFPGLTVATGLLLPAITFDGGVWFWIIGWAVAGALVYVFYANTHAAKIRRSESVVGKEDQHVTGQAKTRYKVLVVANEPARARRLIDLGKRLARARQGDLVVLQILVLADQMPDYIKRQRAQSAWKQLSEQIDSLAITDVHIEAVVRLTASMADGIVASVSDEQADLLVLDWHEESEDIREASFDFKFDTILRHARCDIVIVKGDLPEQAHAIVAPTAGGPNAPTAARIGADLSMADESSIVVVHVVTEPETQQVRETAQMKLDATLLALQDVGSVESRIVYRHTVSAGLASEIEKAVMLVIGAAQEGVFERSYFGGQAIRIAEDFNIPAIMASTRRRTHYTALTLLWDALSGPLPKLTRRRRADVVAGMRVGAQPTVDFFVLILLSAVIATLGLLQNSAAVIIGAMLVAPLMTPILSMGMSMVVSDLKQLRVAAEATVQGAALAIVVGVVTVLLSPIQTVTIEILSRTTPNVLDLVVALASGAAAGYAVSRKEVAAALPGVAIAAALVPPLCVVGIGFGMADITIATGALLLFITNLVAIVFAAALTFIALGFFPERENRNEVFKGLRITVILLAIVAGILIVATISTSRQLALIKTVEQVLDDGLEDAAEVDVISVRRQGDYYLITADILSYENVDVTAAQLQRTEDELTRALEAPVQLTATVISGYSGDINDLDKLLLINDMFTTAVTELNADIAWLDVGRTDNGYLISTVIILYEDSLLTEAHLHIIQLEISTEIRSEVTTDATFIHGTRAKLDPVTASTKTPTTTPSPTAERDGLRPAKPTDTPQPVPTDTPTSIPEPTNEPTSEPTRGPTRTPTDVPTQEPTEEPLPSPTSAPTLEPTEEPTAVPTEEPPAATPAGG